MSNNNVTPPPASSPEPGTPDGGQVAPQTQPQYQYAAPESTYGPQFEGGAGGVPPYGTSGSYYPGGGAGSAPKQRNVVGLIAFIVSIVGFVFACIPGALIIGWILLPIAFILSLVSLFMRGQAKALGISGLVISVVGTVVGVLVAVGTFVLAVDDALTGGEVEVTAPEVEEAVEDELAASPADTEESAVEGSRENPYPLGSTVTQGDWAVTVNEVNLDANEVLADENLFNEPPAEGSTYIMVNLTAQYVGEDPNGDMPTVLLDYVTVEGNTINGFEAFVISPEEFDSVGTLYEGASTTGNRSFAVPADSVADGVLALTPHVFGDKVFVAVK